MWSFHRLRTQAEYGLLSGRIAENAPTRPTTAYGAAKLGVGLLLERIAVESCRPFTWLRLFSTYGPDDDPSWLIPYVVRTLLAGRKPSLTKAQQTWDYLYVDDVVDAVINSLDYSAQGIFNLGSGRGRPLKEIITLIRDLIDPTLPLGFGEVMYRTDQVMHLESNIAGLIHYARWSPKIELEEGMLKTISWFKNQQENVF